MGMAVVKRSVSFDADLLAEVTAEVGPGAVSAAVNEALADLLWRRRALAAIAAHEAAHGAIPAAALSEADALLDGLGFPPVAPPTLSAVLGADPGMLRPIGEVHQRQPSE
jgi:Arc/MetJ family transcription regulator